MRWVKETLPPRPRARWLLMTMRLSASSLAGTARTLVAVGTWRLLSMFFTTRAAGPRSLTVPSVGADTCWREDGREVYPATAGCAAASGAGSSASPAATFFACGAGAGLCDVVSEPGRAVGRASRESLVERADGSGVGSGAGESVLSLVPAEAGCEPGGCEPDGGEVDGRGRDCAVASTAPLPGW